MARLARFALEDPLLRFWFRFVFPNRSSLAQLGPQKAFQHLIKPQLDPFLGSCFEALCREALPVLYDREKVTAAFEVGEFWDKQTQIDVVGLRNDDWTDLAECRWGGSGSLARLADELDQKVRRYPNQRNATIGRRIFVRNRPSKQEAGWKVHDLEELYGSK